MRTRTLIADEQLISDALSKATGQSVHDLANAAFLYRLAAKTNDRSPDATWVEVFERNERRLRQVIHQSRMEKVSDLEFLFH